MPTQHVHAIYTYTKYVVDTALLIINLKAVSLVNIYLSHIILYSDRIFLWDDALGYLDLSESHACFRK